MHNKPYSIDIGGTPYEADCAQLGHTPNFANVNRAEVILYRAAIIALNGVPPEGITLESHLNHHDFGDYRTLHAKVDPARDQGNHADYLDKLDHGVRSWLAAGFAPPEFSRLDRSSSIAAFCNDAIASAMRVTRPRPDGTFFPPEFADLHTNLRAGFTDVAEKLDRMEIDHAD